MQEKIYREEDDEFIGFVEGKGQIWSCLTIFGYKYNEFDTFKKAKSHVISTGLSILLGRWQYYDSELKLWNDCFIQEAATDAVYVIPINGAYYSEENNPKILRKDLNKVLRKIGN